MHLTIVRIQVMKRSVQPPGVRRKVTRYKEHAGTRCWALLFPLSLAVFLASSASLDAGSRLINLSTRGWGKYSIVSTNIMIAGFVVEGGPKKVLLRHIGPTLDKFGVTDRLHSGHPDPQYYNSAGAMFLFFEGNKTETWRRLPPWNRDLVGNDIALLMSEMFDEAGAFLLDLNTFESAAVWECFPGSSSIHTEGTGIAPIVGISLVEIYDLEKDDPNSKLVNLSTRGHVRAGQGVMIAGFVIYGDVPLKVLIRGVGPGLVPHGVPVANVLPDPLLRLMDKDGNEIARSDNWQTDTAPTNNQFAKANAEVFAKTGAFALEADSNDAAIVATLTPDPKSKIGIYTAILSGNGASPDGEGIVEIYVVE